MGRVPGSGAVTSVVDDLFSDAFADTWSSADQKPGLLRQAMEQDLVLVHLNPDENAETVYVYPDGDGTKAFDAIVNLGDGQPVLTPDSMGNLAQRIELPLLALRSAIEASMERTTGVGRILHRGDLIVIPEGTDRAGRWMVQDAMSDVGGAITGRVRSTGITSMTATDSVLKGYA